LQIGGNREKGKTAAGIGNKKKTTQTLFEPVAAQNNQKAGR
jgi:hypothetical protein